MCVLMMIQTKEIHEICDKFYAATLTILWEFVTAKDMEAVNLIICQNAGNDFVRFSPPTHDFTSHGC